MAITRRQFVATFGALAAAMGIGQSDISKLTEAFAYGNAFPGTGAAGKPKVIWVHGAECTGCSTSLLSLFESLSGRAVEAVDYATSGYDVRTATTATCAATLAGAVGLTGGTPNTYGKTELFDGAQSPNTLSIADIVVDVLDIHYHETIMGPGGDMAYHILKDNMVSGRTAGDATTGFVTGARPFVLVVEGAVQKSSEGGYWDETGATPWCSIAMNGEINTSEELKFDTVVHDLAAQATCAAVIGIGQCATYGGYPAAIGGLDPRLNNAGTAYTTKKQTPAYGVYDFLKNYGTNLEKKVINVPGCPANPWWFVLTVVAWLIDAQTALKPSGQTDGALGILAAGSTDIVSTAIDKDQRLKAVFGCLLHGKYCPRYGDYAARKYASKPGESGCLKNIGCKGLSTMSLCTRHGWNATQPQNLAGTALGARAEGCIKTGPDGSTKVGGNCITAGAPCQGCTEKGYPDAFVPFISQR